MAPENPIIFLLEDCPVTGLIVERAVMHELPDVRLLWARTMAEAIARSEGLEVALFLVDIGLPDGNGFDFLWQMAIEHPTSRAIVMTATPLPEHQAHTSALGVLHFLEKPLRIPALVNQLRAALEKATEGEGKNDFRASLKNVTPADILQLKCLSGATTVVEFLSDEQVGRIRLEDGEIVSASTGVLRGVEAVYEILGWKRGNVTEHPCVGFPMRTIDCPWQTLLINAAHRVDERRDLATA
jgi:DNA-binding response OmpR family regulator